MGTYSDPALILPGAVGQTELDASSKKDVANGVAALGAAGALLVPGSKMYYTRDGSDDVHIYERTSDEEAYAFHRVGADDYTFYIKESNVWKRFLTESMNVAYINSDSYSGNSTTNRAIPHNLGKTPAMVLIGSPTAGWYMSIINPGKFNYLASGVIANYDVTPMDDTNFYVGNAGQYDYSGNNTGRTYYWVAIG